MTRPAILLVLVASSCHRSEGVALDLTIDSACAPSDEIARLSGIDVAVTATPPLAGSGVQSLSPSMLFASPGASHRVVVLLPAATRQVELTLTARDLAGRAAGSAQRSYSFNGPAVRADTITLLGEDCALASADLAGADFSDVDFSGADFAGDDLSMPDGATPEDGAADLQSLDLNGSVQVTSVLAQGMLPPTVYEGEGSTQGAAAGVAVLISGSNFLPPVDVVADYGVLGPLYVSADGTHIATSIRLDVDGTLADGEAKTVTLRVTAAGGTASGTFTISGLAELQGPSPAPQIPVGNGPVMFSRILLTSPSAKVQLTGSNRGFLWVTEEILGGGGTITALGGGNSGCTSDPCGPTSGLGHGESGTMTAFGGGGAGYFQNGNDGAASSSMSSGGGTAGTLYGDTSVIGLAGGSGGGAGGGGAAGGAGGGVLRVFAGSISDVNFAATGGTGENASTSNSGGGGGGSGGTILVQSLGGLSGTGAYSFAVSPGGPGAGMGSGGSGGSASAGRVRVDVGTPQTFATPTGPYTMPSGFKYEGGMLLATTQTAYQSLGNVGVQIVCGLGTDYQVILDGFNLGSVTTCAATTNAAAAEVRFLPPVVPAGMHTLCVRPRANSGSDTAHYTGSLAENMNCRSLVSAD